MELPHTVIVNSRKSSWQILIPKNPSRIIKFAAHELRNSIERISNATLNITDKKIKEKQYYIHLEEDSSLPREGFKIQILSENIYLYGNKIGILYGVYEILEQLGCSYIIPGDDCIPKQSRLSLIQQEFQQKPDTKERMVRILAPLDDTDPVQDILNQIDWCAKNRINMISAGLGWAKTRTYLDRPHWCSDRALSEEITNALLDRDIKVLVGGHSFFHWCHPDDYFNKHPEYYSEIDDKRVPKQLCLTNQSVIEIVSKNITDLVKREPAIIGVDLSPMDGDDWCQCKDCIQADLPYVKSGGPFKHMQSRSRSLYKFLDQVALRCHDLEENTKIASMAYIHYTEAPENFKFKSPNISIKFLWYWICSTHALDDKSCETNQFFYKAQKKWIKEHGEKTSIFAGDYHYGMGAWCMMPWPALRLMSENWYTSISLGTNGYAFQYYRADPIQYRITDYIWAKFLWDSSKTKHWEDLLHTTCLKYFGKTIGMIICKYLLHLEKCAQENVDHLYPHAIKYLQLLIREDDLNYLEGLTQEIESSPMGPIQAQRTSMFLWQHKLIKKMWWMLQYFNEGTKHEKNGKETLAKQSFTSAFEESLGTMKFWPDDPAMVTHAYQIGKLACQKLGQKMPKVRMSEDEAVAANMISKL